MNCNLKSDLKKFAELLNAEKNSCSDEKLKAKYAIACLMCEELINKESLSKDDFSKISHYVSDSLPWTSHVLEIWKPISKKFKAI